jgi:glycine/D-amino acid oxidase-like deaminating enzyme
MDADVVVIGAGALGLSTALHCALAGRRPAGATGSGFSSSLAIGEALAAWITTGDPSPGMEALSPARFGPLPDDALITRGIWQYAHYYDPGQ